MAEQLRDIFNASVVDSIARDFRRVHSAFDVRGFTKACLNGLDDLSLTQRGTHVAKVMRRFLPDSYEEAVQILVASFGPELGQSDTFGYEPFRYLPHASFIALYGLDHFEASMRAQYELTKRFTAEFSIRGFLERHPEQTLTRLAEWARDPSEHVRRLVSEGTRPRLPWASRLRSFQEDPTPVLRLLELLKDDPERYVQRSVANNLNDIAKDHPDVVVKVCREWSQDPTPGRSWIVKHALRSLVKSGHKGALGTLGVAAAPEVAVRSVRFEPKRVKLGEALSVTFELENIGPAEQSLLVDYAVHFVKANGERRPKVFKLKKLLLEKGARGSFKATVSFAQMTTRKHYPGRHTAEVLVNGVAFPLGTFDVRA